jgi:glutaredoxin-related protein
VIFLLFRHMDKVNLSFTALIYVRCGFSNAVVQILRMHDVPFTSHDVLADEDIRQGDRHIKWHNYGIH